MLYVLDQQRKYSYPIADNYVIYIHSIKCEDLCMHIIAVDTAPEKDPRSKNEYSLGTYFDETVAKNIMKCINKLRSIGDAHYVMPDEDEEKLKEAIDYLVEKVEEVKE